MIRKVPFQPEHLAVLTLQPQQSEAKLSLGNPELGASLAQEGVAFTGLDEFGRVAACVGATPIWSGRAVGWAVFSQVPPRVWPQLHKLVLRGLDGLQRDPAYKRLEIGVVVGFREAHRWALLLGFEVEVALARSYDTAGRDYVLYVRIR